MDWFRNTKGAISIFLCIVMVIMIALTGALVDGSRIRTAETEVRGALDTSALSELSNYDNVLKELYGLFALAGDDTGIMEESIKYSLNRNLLADLGKAKEVGFDKYYSNVFGFFNKDKTNPLNLFDYKIESIKVNPIYNLSETAVIKNQILETMKYKAPKEVADVFLDKLLSIKDVGKQSKILEKKLDLDEKLNEGRKSQEELSQKAYDINRLGKDNEIKSRLDSLTSKIAERIQKEKELKDVLKLLADLKPPTAAPFNKTSRAGFERGGPNGILLAAFGSKVNPVKTNTDNSGEAGKKAYDEQKKDLGKKIDELNNSIEGLRKEAVKTRDELVKYIDGLISDGAFAKAKKAIENVEKKSEEAGTMANELSKTITDDSSSFGESIRTDLKTKKDKIDTSVLTERQAEIEQCRKVFDEAKAIISSINPDSVSLNADNLPANIADAVKEKLPYKIIESKLKKYPAVNYYVKALNERNEKKDDPREAIDKAMKDIEEQTKALFKDIKGEDAKIKDKFPSSGLPSQGGVVNSIDVIKDLFKKDSKKIEQNQEQVQAAKDFNPDYKGMDNVSGDFSGDNQSDFSKQGLSIISGLTDLIDSGLSAMRDELYVDEYVMGTFKNAVTKKSGKQFDLNGYDILTRQNTFFSDAEVEYILHGEKSQEANIMWTKAQILLIRWALNTIAIYCDPAKVSTALEIATAIAGWTVFGVPVVQTLILLSWSFAESLIDVHTIMSGGEVQIFKTKDSWTLGVSGATGSAAASALKTKVLDSVKKNALQYAKNTTMQVIDYTADEIAGKLEKGTNEEIEKISSNISTEISKLINNKVDEVIDSAFKPFEDAIYSEVGKTKAEFDGLKESIFARERDIVDKAEDEADKLMNTVDEAIYSGAKEYFPEARKVLGDSGYDNLINQLHNKEKQFYEELKNKGFDLLGNKEKEIRDRIDSEEEKIIKSIKDSISKAKKQLKQKITDKINKSLNMGTSFSNVESKIKAVVKKKIDEAKTAGKGKVKEKLSGLFDKMGGKSKGSSLKLQKTDTPLTFTTKMNVKGSLLKMDYKGYLRILLLFMNPDTKIKRIQDLVQLNMVKETGNSGFSLSKCNTCLRVETEVSMKYFFMTSAIMPKQFKGRYKISNTVYKGY